MVIRICKDSRIDVNPLEIEVCHRLPLGRNAINTAKQVIVKFVTSGHSEAMLQRKKEINQKSKVFVSHLLCPYYRFLWGKCKELQRKFRINKVFCLGAAVMVRITKNSTAIKILHKKIPNGMTGMSPRVCEKDYFFMVVIVNYYQLHLTDLVLCAFHILIS